MNEIPIHVINLEHRTDRKEKLLKEFKKHNITNFNFTKAIHGNSLDLNEMEHNKEISPAIRKMTRGEIGIYFMLESIRRVNTES